jgi:type I restriction enzyme, S subunit
MKTGWKLKEIGDLCEVIAGQSPEGKYYNSEGNGVPFYQGKKDFGEKFIDAPTIWTTDTTKIARQGDILMSVRAPVGPINFTTGEICIGRGLAAIRSGSELNHDFLFYQLWSLQPQIAGNAGAVFASINKSDIEKIGIAVAPLPEQLRIVGILDEAFDGVASAKANTEKNLQNVRALFESHLESVFTHRGDGWVEKTMGEVCAKITDGEHLRPKVTDSGVPFLSAKDVLDHDVVFTDALFVSKEDALKFRKRCNPEIGDILIVSRGATVGRTCVVKTTRTFCLLGSVILLKVHGDMSSQFIAYGLKSRTIRNSLATLSEASAQQAIYLRDLRPLRIGYPSRPVQDAIVSRLDTLFAETQRLESIYREKLAALEALKKSLLHQAFSGQL